MEESIITASIVTHCTKPDYLIKALNCLKQSSVNKYWVIDNSPDSSLKEIALSNGAEYIKVENRGFGAGHNIAIRMAMEEGARYHIVMNADVCWSDDVPDLLRGYMDSNMNVGVCMPRVFYPDGILQYSCRMLPTPYDVFVKRFFPKQFFHKRMRRYLLVMADHSKAFNVPYLLGSFMFFRCDTLKKEGLFDERFFMYPEDIDITRRIHRNWKTMYVPVVDIIHVHEAASRKSFRMMWIHIVNMIRYFNKWGWFEDKERDLFNKRLLNIMPVKDGLPDIGRG